MTNVIEAQRILQDALPKIRVPHAGDRVYKDECVFSFDTPVGTATVHFEVECLLYIHAFLDRQPFIHIGN